MIGVKREEKRVFNWYYLRLIYNLNMASESEPDSLSGVSMQVYSLSPVCGDLVMERPCPQ